MVSKALATQAHTSACLEACLKYKLWNQFSNSLPNQHYTNCSLSLNALLQDTTGHEIHILNLFCTSPIAQLWSHVARLGIQFMEYGPTHHIIIWFSPNTKVLLFFHHLHL